MCTRGWRRRVIPFYVLIVSFLLFHMADLVGLHYFEDWQMSLRGAVAVMLLFIAYAHWGKRRLDLIRMFLRFFQSRR